MNLRRWQELAVHNIDRIIAIACIGVLFYAIITKLISDVSYLIENNPGNFWSSFLNYLLKNLSAQ